MTQTKVEERGAEQSLAAMPAVRQVPDDVALAVEVSGRTVSAAEVQVLRDTICKRLSLGQLQLFLAACHHYGVSPLTGAYAFPSGDGIAFGLKIDGMRALARKAAKYSRKLELITKPEDKATIIGARCEILREGDSAPFVSEVLLREFRKGGSWDVMPEVMIKKVAEAHALRAAYPDALSGVYEPSEMERPDESQG